MSLISPRIQNNGANDIIFNSADFIDIHYHATPDAYLRRYGALAAGKLYQQMNGVVILKSHLGSSVASAIAAQEIGLPVMGSVVLNTVAGGINRQPILQALSQINNPNAHRLIVHLPTFVLTSHQSQLSRAASNGYSESAINQKISFRNKYGKLTTDVVELMIFAKDHPIVLSTGHADKASVLEMIDLAEKINLPRLLLNQPASPMTGFTALELLELGKSANIYIEQTALTYLLGYQTKQDFFTALVSIPNLIYSSDLGQPSQIDCQAWQAQTKNWFTLAALSKSRIKKICLSNPFQMLEI